MNSLPAAWLSVADPVLYLLYSPNSEESLLSVNITLESDPRYSVWKGTRERTREFLRSLLRDAFLQKNLERCESNHP